CDYAQRALAQLALGQVEIQCDDARRASFGSSSVFFLYTPFRGAALRLVLARLRELARTRHLRICACGPCAQELAREPWLVARRPSLGPDAAVFDSLPR